MEMETDDDEDADIPSTTEEDIATLPILYITPDVFWCPSNFNETDRGLSFNPPCLAQMMTTTMEDVTNEVFHDAIPDLQNIALDPDTEPMVDPTAMTVPEMTPNPVPCDSDPDDPIFHDAQTDLLLDEGHFFDSSDGTTAFGFVGQAFHLSMDPMAVIDLVDVDCFLMTLDHAELRRDHEDFNSFGYISRIVSTKLDTYHANADTQIRRPNSIYPAEHLFQSTLECTDPELNVDGGEIEPKNENETDNDMVPTRSRVYDIKDVELDNLQSDKEDNLSSNYIVIRVNTDTSEKGDSKDVKSRKRGDDVSPCHLKSWIKSSMSGMQPKYPLVQYGR
jgi:hypothetical protein